MLWRTAFHLLSPAGDRGRLSILIFHRVLARPDPLFPEEPDAARFARIMEGVARWFRVLPLSEAVARLAGNALPARALAITFDDGYADNHDVALPILEKLGLPATCFVATDYLDGGRMWNDTVIEAVRAHPGDCLDLARLNLGTHPLAGNAARRAAIDTLLRSIKYQPDRQRRETVAAIAELAGQPLPDKLMLTRAQLRDLPGRGMELGGHTCSHPILARLPDHAAQAEIAHGREALTALAGVPIRLFAYPNGKPGQDYAPRHAEMVQRAGFNAAVSTHWGAARRGSDLFQLPRFTPWDSGLHRFAGRMAWNLIRS